MSSTAKQFMDKTISYLALNSTFFKPHFNFTFSTLGLGLDVGLIVNMVE